MTTTSLQAAPTHGQTPPTSPAATAQPDQRHAWTAQPAGAHLRPTHRTPGPPGPTSRLVALPQLNDGLPAAPNDLDAYLAELERARQYQLDALPAHPTNVVTIAHHRFVAQLLADVRSARQRIRNDTYGRCTRCRSAIETEALTREPCQPTCTPCTTPRTT